MLSTKYIVAMSVGVLVSLPEKLSCSQQDVQALQVFREQQPGYQFSGNVFGHDSCIPSVAEAAHRCNAQDVLHEFDNDSTRNERSALADKVHRIPPYTREDFILHCNGAKQS